MDARLAILSAISLAGVSGACTSGLVNARVPPPGSENFQVGYINGCASGLSDAGREDYLNRYAKDEQRYATRPDYRDGWERGHNACYEDEQRHPAMFGANSR